MTNLGKTGEQLAASVLIDSGYKIIEKNYRYGHGEIDIIAEINDILVFIEVKTRKNKNFGEPEYAVTASKQKQINKIAQAYLYQYKINDKDCRFDVITILFNENNLPQINHIENAF